MTRRSICAECGRPVWWQVTPGYWRHDDPSVTHVAVVKRERPSPRERAENAYAESIGANDVARRSRRERQMRELEKGGGAA